MHAATTYDPALTMREARARYFEANRFGADGGYSSRWVVLKIGSMPFFAFPNSDARRRAVRYHDLHHVLTGYSTSLAGECEISAWELSSGCRDLWAAWLLDLGALGLGVLTAPRKMLRAFARGRHTRNLYDRVFDDALLGRRVGELCAELGLDSPAPAPDRADRRAFYHYAAAGVAVMVGQSLLVAAPLAALYWLLK